MSGSTMPAKVSAASRSAFFKKVVIADNFTLVLAYYVPAFSTLLPGQPWWFGTLNLSERWFMFAHARRAYSDGF